MDDDTVSLGQYKALNTMPHPQFAALLLTLLNAGWSLSCSIHEAVGEQYEARIRVEHRDTTAAFRSTVRHEMPGDALYTALVMIFMHITDRERSLKR